MRWIIGAIALGVLGFALLVLPRGELAGTDVSAPDSWDFVGEDQLCLLETSAPIPRSVRVGCYSVGGQLYVHSHRWTDRPRPFGTSWVAEVEKNPLVRIQIHDSVYFLRATEVVSPDEKKVILVPRGHDPVPPAMRLFTFASVVE